MPTILIRPVQNLAGDPDDDYVSIGLTTELAHELSRYRNIRVLLVSPEDAQGGVPETPAAFILDGNFRRDPNGVRIAVQLVDAQSATQIWSETFQGDLETAKMIAFQEEVARKVAVRVAGDFAVIPKHLARIGSRKAAADLTVYEAILRFWMWNFTFSPESYFQAMDALHHAVTSDPDAASAWSMLAVLYGFNYAVEIVDSATSLETAFEYAQRGVQLDPNDQRNRLVMAYIHILGDQIHAAQSEIESAYALQPDAIIHMDIVGWAMVLTGQRERGASLIQRAIDYNPYCRPYARHGMWIYHYSAEAYEAAYQETMHFTAPHLMWDHIFRACICGRQGKKEEGRESVRTLLSLKPEFSSRGRILIGRYIKFEEISSRMFEDLDSLDLPLD